LIKENDGAVTKEFKIAMLASITKHMKVFVEITEDDDEKIVPNSIKAALLDPRSSKDIQVQLGTKTVFCVF